MEWAVVIGTAIASGVCSGAVCWGVMKTELKYLRRDVDHAHDRIDRLEGRFNARA